MFGKRIIHCVDFLYNHILMSKESILSADNSEAAKQLFENEVI